MLPEFRLERWLRAQEKVARLAIGGSGVARGDITPFLPADLAKAWSTHPDEASRALREAVGRQFGVPSANVLPAAGASEADAATVLGLAGPGAHVVVERPAYHALIQPALAFGCKVERAERAAPSFELGALPIRPDTKLIVLARPNNPTGAVVPADRLIEIAESAPQAWILVDEVFADATALDHPACKLHPRILSVNSVTKCLGFSGLRCGWVAGAPEALEAIDRAKAHLSVNNALLDLIIGARVVEARPKLVERTRALRAANATVLAEFLAGSKKLVGHPPAHGTTCLLQLPSGTDDITFSARLASERGVVAPPGSFVEAPGWIRVGLVGDPAALREGLAEIDRAL